MQIRRRAYLAVLLLVLFIALIHFNQERKAQADQDANFVDRVPITFYAPVLELWQDAKQSVSGVWDDYFALVGAKRENARLKEELDFSKLYILSLKERLKMREREAYFGQELKALGWEGVPARLIGYDPYSRSQTAWISVGSDRGIREDMPVITLEGLVGRVIKVTASTSQVLLLVDSHFSVDVISESTRVRALVVGSGNGAAIKRYPLLTHLEYLRLGDEINAGDLFMTSGLSEQYPGGIPVGNVIEVERREEDNVVETSVVLPLVDFGKLEQVIVLTSFKNRGEMAAAGEGGNP